jgi:hypothetical protein
MLQKRDNEIPYYARTGSKFMDKIWLSEFQKRIQKFGATKGDELLPVSIKIRPTGGCFHREHSPNAYEIIDEYLSKNNVAEQNGRFEEHESGPELLVFLAVTAAGLGVVKSVVELVTTIIKARSEGTKKGDAPSAPLELIVRGYSKKGEYFEEIILRVPPGHILTAKEVEKALANLKQFKPKERKRKKK